MVDELFYPILNNPANQQGWPEVIKKDMDFHLQELKNIVSEVMIYYSCERNKLQQKITLLTVINY